MKFRYPILVLFLWMTSLSFGQDRPNVILIFTDDQGYADVGANGQVSDIKTPNLDLLAKNGALMTSGYVTAPQCIPSRAGLLTGRYQQRFGLDHNGLIPLPLSETLIAERMQKAGYVTGMTGKWHLDPNHQSNEWIVENMPELNHKKKYQPEDIPFEKKIPYMSSNRGFEKTFQGYGTNYWATYTLDGDEIEAQWIKQEGYRLDVQTDAAVEFIKKNSDKPFFYYLSYFAPHVPLEATKKYLDRFPEDMPVRRRYCLAMMSAIDDGVGKIKQTLREMGVEENTIIFFISDNGAPLKITMEDKPISFQGGAWDGSLNTPWVGEKGMLSEGGIRVPFIINWPKGIPGGQVYDRPVISLDVAATCAAIAGLGVVDELDGVNLVPYLNGERKEDPHEAIYWRFWGQQAVRMGNYKFLKAGDMEYLFDVSTSEHENKNLIQEYPDMAKTMRKSLMDWNSELKNPVSPFGEIGNEYEWYEHYFKN
ncbi:sulfatase-like hydrolase/transferase [Muricauda ruestringensis]|uniref:sulfatase family protein n=1 Tax=Flagellimonas ruestringensis TaxID=111501 RepID=UPI001CD57B08|nr:sulfatase-like hydrolase/transferase [Allomuricauda ruestringensis]MCA0957662.1 sulfatase-like hydrolase/transferase [Allomuricauda ruestringensis]